MIEDVPGPAFGFGWDRMRGWRDQYDRMLRWHVRLRDAAQAPPSSHDQWADLWDVAMTFFQNAFHLRDWILVERPDLRTALDEEISSRPALSYCADIANGTKHRHISRSHRVPQHLTGVREYAPHLPGLVRYTILGPGAPIDLLQLAAECVAEWGAVVAEHSIADTSDLGGIAFRDTGLGGGTETCK